MDDMAWLHSYFGFLEWISRAGVGGCHPQFGVACSRSAICGVPEPLRGHCGERFNGISCSHTGSLPELPVVLVRQDLLRRGGSLRQFRTCPDVKAKANDRSRNIARMIDVLHSASPYIPFPGDVRFSFFGDRRLSSYVVYRHPVYLEFCFSRRYTRLCAIAGSLRPGTVSSVRETTLRHYNGVQPSGYGSPAARAASQGMS